MLYFIAVWSILIILSWIVGIALIIGLKANCFDRISDRTMAALWLGMVVLADGLLLLSLGLPLSPINALAVVVGICLLLLAWAPIRTEIQHLWSLKSPLLLAVTTIWSILIAAYMTQRVTWFDTGLYHFASIRWLSEFGTVPGLALLLNNLGFTSSWFALAAPLNTASLAPHATAATNGLIFLVATYHGLIALWYRLTDKARVTDKFILAFIGFVLPALVFTTFLSAVLVSPSPDIPVILLTGTVAWSILTTVNKPRLQTNPIQGNHWDAFLIPLILAAGTVSIKLSALPLLPIAFLFYWSQQIRDLRRLLIGGLIALLFLSPLMIVSIMTSGCPIYPSSILCMDVPWRVPMEDANQALEVIRVWSHFGPTPPDQNPLLWRLWEWLKFARLNFVLLLLLAVSAFSMAYTFRSARKQGINGTPWLFGLSITGMVFILLRAPMIRFGLGYFVMTPAIMIAVVGSAYLSRRKWQWPRLSSKTVFLFKRPVHKLMLAGLGLIGTIILVQPDVRLRLLLPPAMPTAEVQAKQSHDVQYVAPVSDRGQCWDAPLPCTPDSINIRLRNPARGLKAGFVPAKHSSQQ